MLLAGRYSRASTAFNQSFGKRLDHLLVWISYSRGYSSFGDVSRR